MNGIDENMQQRMVKSSRSDLKSPSPNLLNPGGLKGERLQSRVIKTRELKRLAPKCSSIFESLHRHDPLNN